MRNPFEDLFDRRRRHQRRVRVELQERALNETQDDERYQARLREKQRYDGMVTELLTQFVQAFDPSLQLYSYNKGWSVGMWDKHTDNSLRWHAMLDVQLEFEVDDKPLYFVVSRHRKKMRVGIGAEELAQALHHLYAPGN